MIADCCAFGIYSMQWHQSRIEYNVTNRPVESGYAACCVSAIRAGRNVRTGCRNAQHAVSWMGRQSGARTQIRVGSRRLPSPGGECSTAPNRAEARGLKVKNPRWSPYVKRQLARSHSATANTCTHSSVRGSAGLVSATKSITDSRVDFMARKRFIARYSTIHVLHLRLRQGPAGGVISLLSGPLHLKTREILHAGWPTGTSPLWQTPYALEHLRSPSPIVGGETDFDSPERSSFTSSGVKPDGRITVSTPRCGDTSTPSAADARLLHVHTPSGLRAATNAWEPCASTRSTQGYDGGHILRCPHMKTSEWHLR